MKEVILSHDSEAILYLVPDVVADNLGQYCLDFAANWIWNGPEKCRFLKDFGNGQPVAMFGAPDFIDYLNNYAFPAQRSEAVKGLGCYDYELPDEYKDYPRYNF